MDELLVARLAEAQHGVVGGAQLRAAGASPTMVGNRVRRGAWTRLHRGVYAIGHAPLMPRGRWMAAVLACGPGAVLSHRSAAELWDLVPGFSPTPHVTVPTAGGRGLPGITVHRRAQAFIARSSVDAIPVTMAAQAIVDAASALGRRSTEKMLDQAKRRRLCAGREIDAAVRALRGQRGVGVVRAVRADHVAGSTVTRSHLEELFLALCRRERLPTPQVNAAVHGLTVDFYWPEHLLAVETDGWGSHHTPEAQQQDAGRTNRLGLAGILLLRFTYADVTRQAKGTAASVRSALRGRGPGLAGVE